MHSREEDITIKHIFVSSLSISAKTQHSTVLHIVSCKADPRFHSPLVFLSSSALFLEGWVCQFVFALRHISILCTRRHVWENILPRAAIHQAYKIPARAGNLGGEPRYRQLVLFKVGLNIGRIKIIGERKFYVV